MPIPPLTDYEFDPLRGLTCLDALFALHEHDLPQSAVLLSEEQVVNLTNAPTNGAVPNDDSALASAVAALSLEQSPKITIRDTPLASVGETSDLSHQASLEGDLHLPGQIRDTPRCGSAPEAATLANSKESRLMRFRRSATSDGTTNQHSVRQQPVAKPGLTAQNIDKSDLSELAAGRPRASTMDSTQKKPPRRQSSSPASGFFASSSKGEVRKGRTDSPKPSTKTTPSQFLLPPIDVRHTSDSSSTSIEPSVEQFERRASLPQRLKKKALFRGHWGKRRKDRACKLEAKTAKVNLCWCVPDAECHLCCLVSFCIDASPLILLFSLTVQ